MSELRSRLLQALIPEGVVQKFFPQGADDMSDTDLKAFLPRVLKDSVLQDQLKNLTDKDKFTQTLVRLGKDNGFHFTAEDVDASLFRSKKNPVGELSEADLALVAGGARSQAWTTLFGWCN
jgi:predicted ribosomally synthesized peptide with nif11-like leader